MNNTIMVIEFPLLPIIGAILCIVWMQYSLLYSLHDMKVVNNSTRNEHYPHS